MQKMGGMSASPPSVSTPGSVHEPPLFDWGLLVQAAASLASSPPPPPASDTAAPPLELEHAQKTASKPNPISNRISASGSPEPDHPTQLRIPIARHEDDEIVHLGPGRIRLLHLEDDLGGAEVVRQEQPRARCRPIGGCGPSLQVGATALFEESQEVTAKTVDSDRLEHRLDGSRQRGDAALHVTRERKPRVGDAERRQKQVFQIGNRPHE